MKPDDEIEIMDDVDHQNPNESNLSILGLTEDSFRTVEPDQGMPVSPFAQNPEPHPGPEAPIGPALREEANHTDSFHPTNEEDEVITFEEEPVGDTEEVGSKKNLTFVVILFAFLILFTFLLPYLSKLFS